MKDVQALIKLIKMQKEREKRLTCLSRGMLHKTSGLAEVDILIADSQNLMTDIEIQERFRGLTN